MSYRNLPYNGPNDFDGLREWLEQELNRVSLSFQEGNYLILPALEKEPSKPRDGLTVRADGTNWNPGDGAGVYCFYNATWNKLG